MPGPEVVVDGQRSGIGCADGGSNRGDFVFRLKSDDAEIFVLRELVQNVGSRRDGIAALEKL